MKKITILLSLIIISSAAFAGCSAGSTSAVSADSGTQQVAAASKKKKANKKVKKAKQPATQTQAPASAPAPAPTAQEQSTQPRPYMNYSKAAFDAEKEHKRVLFFHAAWCPICKSAEQDITKNLNLLPKDVVVFKADYDTEKDLKKKYNITYQHTFVYVDAAGEEVKKWNGGASKEIIANTK